MAFLECANLIKRYKSVKCIRFHKMLAIEKNFHRRKLFLQRLQFRAIKKLFEKPFNLDRKYIWFRESRAVVFKAIIPKLEK